MKKNEKSKKSGSVPSSLDVLPSSSPLQSYAPPAPAPSAGEGEVFENVDMNTAYRMLVALRVQTIEFVSSWKSTIVFCREHLLPKQVEEVLVKAGYRSSRISEFRGILSLPDVEFEAYKIGEVGFKASLEKAREEKSKQRTGKSTRDAFVKVVGVARKFVSRSKVLRSASACLFQPSEHTNGIYLLLLDGKSKEYEFKVDGRIIQVSLSTVDGAK